LTPLPPIEVGAEWVVWRLDKATYAGQWHKAQGAYLAGGRWNSVGRRTLYTSVDPATTILESAVHKGFKALDTISHVLLGIQITIADASQVLVVRPGDVSNPNWLRPGDPSPNQQAFADELLEKHPIVLIPSVVSTHSWNVLVNAVTAAPMMKKVHSEVFALDTRLARVHGAPGKGSTARRSKAANF
jgi:RES domain-containing protein